MNDDWKEYERQAAAEAAEYMPAWIVKDIPCAKGYRAQVCLRRAVFKYCLEEVKARFRIISEGNGMEVAGCGWVVENSMKKKLRAALSELAELVLYKERMSCR